LCPPRRRPAGLLTRPIGFESREQARPPLADALAGMTGPVIYCIGSAPVLRRASDV